MPGVPAATGGPIPLSSIAVVVPLAVAAGIAAVGAEAVLAEIGVDLAVAAVVVEEPVTVGSVRETSMSQFHDLGFPRKLFGARTHVSSLPWVSDHLLTSTVAQGPSAGTSECRTGTPVWKRNSLI